MPSPMNFMSAVALSYLATVNAFAARGMRHGSGVCTGIATPISPFSSAVTAAPNDSAEGLKAESNSMPWEDRAEAIFSRDKRPVVLFDGVCNLCNGGVNFVLDWDIRDQLRFCALQSESGRALLQRSGKKPSDISSIVLVDEKTAYFRSDAILGIADRLAIPFPVLSMVAGTVPRFGRDLFYNQIAKNRYNFFGKSNVCRLSDDRFESKFISD